MHVTFNEFAEFELNETIRYYEHERTGLGVAFLAEVQRCTAAIIEYPDASPIVLGSVRRRLCQRFPYALLYTRKGDDIRILAVMNLKRRPSYWVNRQ